MVVFATHTPQWFNSFNKGAPVKLPCFHFVLVKSNEVFSLLARLFCRDF